MATNKIVGNPTPRVEGEEKVTGTALYAVDVVLPGMLWGKVLRSPVPFGRIKRIDVERAAALPGVRAVVTGEDVAGLRIGRRIYDMPILAYGIVRFIGEKVAAVAAATEEIAQQALELIEIEYDEMDPLLDPLDAIEPSATLLHPDVMSYKGLPQPLSSPSNAVIQMSWRKGDVGTGFAESDVIVENTFRTPIVHQAYIEPHSCVVKADESGGAEIWACSKVPFALRDQLANAVGVSSEKFLIHPCYIGGDFGGKGDFMDVPVCYFLSRKSGRPVKMVMDYDEEFAAGNPRHAAVIRVKTGVTNDGRLVAHHLDFVFDSGAYAAFKPVGFLHGPASGAGPYRIPHALIEEKIVYTNKIPCGHMRSPGDPQAFFANESQMDLVAKRLGLDPVAFRKMNLMHDGDEAPTGKVITHIRAEETLDKAVQLAGYYRPKKKGVGRGVAIVQWLPNSGESYVFVKIDRSGAVTVAAAMLDQGAGTYTLMCEIAAEELKVPLERVRVEILDTGQVAKDTGVGGSRSTRVYGNATYEAAVKARDEITNAAAQKLGCAPEELALADGAAVHRKSRRRVTYAEAAEATGGEIRTRGYYNDATSVPEASMCAQVAEVQVDEETGEVKVTKIISAHSTGTVLNPLMHQGQIDGGVVMGLGYGLMEQVVLEEGKVTTANFGDYKIPTAKDIPALETAVLQTPKGPGPYSSMSIGETPNIPVAAAIANAVEDATRVRITSLPITAEKILSALRGA